MKENDIISSIMIITSKYKKKLTYHIFVNNDGKCFSSSIERVIEKIDKYLHYENERLKWEMKNPPPL